MKMVAAPSTLINVKKSLETVSASCKIGDYVGINGRIHSRKYQKDEKVYLNYGFVAEKIDFLR